MLRSSALSPTALLNDPRDIAFIYTSARCLILVAIGLSLFFIGNYVWWAALPYWALLIAMLGPFVLMLHCTSHRPLFRPAYRPLNYLIPWLIGPFFGETPESYAAHHIHMHHIENNLADDLSSTLKYQRASLLHWLHYLFSFLFFGLPQLAMYFGQRKRSRLLRRLLIGELGYWIFVALLILINWQATLVVFVIPVLLVRSLMMMGNWAQHAFVDAEDPGNPYKNSITCINTPYNKRCFNDGYHIHHHVKPVCHWRDYPSEFEEHRERYGTEDAVVFDGIDFFQVWLLLMSKRWHTLARHVVQLPGAPQRNQSEIIAWLKSRTEPID